MSVTGQRTVTGTIANGQNVQTLVSDRFTSRADRTTLVVYVHGSGEAQNGPTTDTLKESLVQFLMNYGCNLIACNAQGDAWGNPASMADYVSAVSYAVNRWEADDVFLFSQSMGGLAGLNLYAANTIANVRGWAGIYPVTNLSAMFASNAGTYAGPIRTAYGIAANGSDYASKTSGSDPNLKTAATWHGKLLRFWASTGDTVVGKAANSDTLAATALSGGAREASVVACAGDHGDPSHFQPADFLAFMQRCGVNV